MAQTQKAIKVTIDPRTVEMQRELVKKSPEFNKALDTAKELQAKVAKGAVTGADTVGTYFKTLLVIGSAGIKAGIERWMIGMQIDERLGASKDVPKGTVRVYRSLATRVMQLWGTDTLKTAAEHAGIQLPEKLEDIGNNAATKALAQIEKDRKNPDRVTLDALLGFQSQMLRVFAEADGYQNAMNHVAAQVEDLRKVSPEVNKAYLNKFIGTSDTEASRAAAQKFTSSAAGQFIINNRDPATENELEQAVADAQQDAGANDEHGETEQRQAANG